MGVPSTPPHIKIHMHAQIHEPPTPIAGKIRATPPLMLDRGACRCHFSEPAVACRNRYRCAAACRGVTGFFNVQCNCMFETGGANTANHGALVDYC